jgi:drug/metabolite transporter (DMT)-like permease
MQAPAPARSPSPLAVRASLALLCLVWGSTWVVIRGGLDDLPPFTSAAARFVLASVAMSAVAARFGQSESGAPPPAYLWVTLGVLNFGASYAIVYCAELVLPSGLVNLLWGVFPLMMAVAGHLFLPGERLHGAQWLGFALGLAGLALLCLTDVPSFGEGAVAAALVLFLSPLVSAVGNTLVKLRGVNVRSLELNRNAMLLGAALLVAAALAFERDARADWTPAAIASVVYLALCGTVLTFGLYFWLLRHVAAHRLSLIAYVTPAIGVALGALFRGEIVTAYTLAGGALILGGVVLVVRGRAH